MYTIEKLANGNYAIYNASLGLYVTEAIGHGEMAIIEYESYREAKQITDAWNALA